MIDVNRVPIDWYTFSGWTKVQTGTVQ